MIIFPNAKINIGLHVTGKRDDGFHNIETLFYPVGLTDIIEVIPLSGKKTKTSLFNQTGVSIDCEPAGNLCLRAWSALNERIAISPVKIHLHKIIPMGAGLGGGSSDAAFVLRALRDIFSLDLSDDGLSEVAAAIGSDCPFFIYNNPAFGTGKGELLEKSEIDLTGYKICIVHPGTGINTGWAYSIIRPGNHDTPLKDILKDDPSMWRGRVVNDFEQAVSGSYPVTADIRNKLYGEGAFYASMTGSGSAVYGLFEANTLTGRLKEKFPGMFVWEGTL